MRPENERLAAAILAALKMKPATIEELSQVTFQTEDRTRYIVTQLVKKKQIVRLPERRYGHAERVSQTTPPLFSK